MIELIYQLIDKQGKKVGTERVMPFYRNRRSAEAYRKKILSLYPQSEIQWVE